MARTLKSGKIALKLGDETMIILRLAVQQRLYFEELPEYLYFLLEEALEKLEGDSCKLQKSEFFAIFQEATMQYIDLPTQLLIREAAQLAPLKSVEPLCLPMTVDENIPI